MQEKSVLEGIDKPGVLTYNRNSLDDGHAPKGTQSYALQCRPQGAYSI